jgi:hypothetical protein
MEFPELKLGTSYGGPNWAVVGKVKYQVGTIRTIVAKLGSWWARKISGYAVPLMVVGVVRPIYSLL